MVNQPLRLRQPLTEGPYLPPGKLILEMGDREEISLNEDNESYQRLSWEALKRSLNGLINKINTSNIAEIVEDLIELNLIRGRGLLIRVTLLSQAQSPIHTPVYAAMFAIINTKFPLIGELLIKRLIIEFRSSFAKNDKERCYSSLLFLAHLVNQRVLHDICILQILMLLLERPTDDSIEIAIKLIENSGKILSLQSPKPFNAIFERLRSLLQNTTNTTISKRVQYKIETLFSLRRQGFQPSIPSKELDLVEEDEQQTHTILLDSSLDSQTELDLFIFDDKFIENEAEYREIRNSILGGSHDNEAIDDEEQKDDSNTNTNNEDDDEAIITDLTSQDSVQFRKTVYLTIMSSLDYEECGHKLLQMNIPQERWSSLVQMIVDCSSNEKTYLKFYGFLSERFCFLDLVWRSEFENAFIINYQNCASLSDGGQEIEISKVRNITKLFSHLLTHDAISWAIFECIILRADSTSSTQRIWVKFLFIELGLFYGEEGLWKRINIEGKELAPYFTGIFPEPPSCNDDDNEEEEEVLDHLRFCVNYFTAIGLPSLARLQREFLNSKEE